MPRTSRKRPPPEAVDLRSNETGLRAIATFEAIKGLLAILLGLGLLTLLHKDVEQVAESLLLHLHIGEERRISHSLLRLAEHTTDARLWAIAGGALAYASVRFAEAYGLWHRRVWAEWFALLSGTLYLPLEIYKLVEHSSFVHWVVLLGNVAIVLYMGFVRLRACRGPDCPPEV
jgi:uncharacterized membrane protein (DUF2068 family)